MKNKICAVIVTYNRRKYLEKLINILIKDENLSGIFIFDNHGEDDTRQYLQENLGFPELKAQMRLFESDKTGKQIFYFRNDHNSGGSGGFSKAVELAMKSEWDYLWIMDDDVLPEKDCLSYLLDGIDEGHKVCIPNRTDGDYVDHAAIKYSLHNPFKIRMKNRLKTIKCSELMKRGKDYAEVFAFTFEGPLISTEIVKKIGYPNADYFILYDDSDYCRRCLEHTHVRMVLNAILHKQIIPSKEDAVSWRTYYVYRNCFYFDHTYGKNYLTRNLRPFLISHSLMAQSIIRGDRLKYNILRAAYLDFKKGKMGKTVIPGELDDYLGRYNKKSVL